MRIAWLVLILLPMLSAIDISHIAIVSKIPTYTVFDQLVVRLTLAPQSEIARQETDATTYSLVLEDQKGHQWFQRDLNGIQNSNWKNNKLDISSGLTVESGGWQKPLKVMLIKKSRKGKTKKITAGTPDDFTKDIITIQKPYSKLNTVRDILIEKANQWYALKRFDLIQSSLGNREFQEKNHCDFNVFMALSQIGLHQDPYKNNNDPLNPRNHISYAFFNLDSCKPETLQKLSAKLGKLSIEVPIEETFFVVAPGTDLTVRNPSDEPVRIQIRDTSRGKIAVEISVNGKSICQWPDPNCIIKEIRFQGKDEERVAVDESPLNQDPLLSQTGLEIVLQKTKGAFAEISVLGASNKMTLQKLCTDYFGEKNAPIHLVMAANGFEKNPHEYKKLLDEEVTLFRIMLGQRMKNIRISTFSGTVPCQQNYQGFFSCNTFIVGQACNVDRSFINIQLSKEELHLAADKSGAGGITNGDSANCIGFAASDPTCFRHEMGHLLFGLPDKYRGSILESPIVFSTKLDCEAFVKKEFNEKRFLPTYRKYLVELSKIKYTPNYEYPSLGPVQYDLNSRAINKLTNPSKPPRCSTIQYWRNGAQSTTIRFIVDPEDQPSVMSFSENGIYSFDELYLVDQVITKMAGQIPNDQKLGPSLQPPTPDRKEEVPAKATISPTWNPYADH